MSIKDIIVSSYQVLVTWRKRKLVKAAQVLRDRYKELLERNNELSEKIKGSEEGISTLYEENKRLKEAIDRKKIIST